MNYSDLSVQKNVHQFGFENVAAIVNWASVKKGSILIARQCHNLSRVRLAKERLLDNALVAKVMATFSLVFSFIGSARLADV